MNIIKRSLAMLLTLCMLFSAALTTAFAAEADSTTSAVTKSTTSTSDFIKVFHLDCGRKYFTVDQIKELIDALSAVGFSHMELAIGNDGLRLLLDDMSIEANGTTYASETVKSGIQSGNANYSHSGEWSEDEMDTIIAYAKTKGIEIIPLVNNPGHMDSILAAMSACDIDGNYATSVRTVDLENAEAVAFTQALVMKYAAYFADKGCNYFNIGADEYANDYHTSDSTGMGFGYLVSKNKYGNFINYVNTLVADICDLGMTPIAFNDGIYYNNTTSQGTFDTRLVVAAWTGGWGGIKPASTSFLQSKGHQILNTNERWYYVPSATSGYTYSNSLSNAKSVSVETVTDNSGATPMGAMQCVWFDYPNVNYSSYKSNILTLINTLAENNPTYFTGPNEVTPDPEPEEPETVTKTDEATKVEITAPGLTGLTVAEATAPAIEGAVEGKVLAWDITPVTANGNYTGEATVSVPVPADWTNVRGGVLASANGEEVMGIKGKLENGIFTFTVPHFSTAVTYASDYDELVELSVGQTSETFTDNSGYYTTAEGLNTAVASAKLGGNAATESTATYTSTTVRYSAIATNTSWTKTNYYYEVDGEYYPVYAYYVQGYWTTYYYGYSTTDSASAVTSVGSSTNGYTRITVYTKSGTEAVPAKTTVAFTGVSVGETTATIGSTTYRIVVSKKAESATVTVGDKLTYADSSTTAPVVSDSSVATAEISNGTLTITAKAAGNVTVTTDNAVYTINVVEFDPSTVPPLTVEYWITNITTRTVESTASSPVTTQQISAAAAGVVTANGADINAMMPEWTFKWDSDSQEDREVEFWHVRLLDKTQTNNSTSGTEQQTKDAGDDETTNGDAVTRVRYYDPGDGNGRRWQMLSGTTWLDVTANSQIVAYYMEVIDIQNANGSTELHVNAADWGKLGDGSPASSYADTSKYCSISLQIVYEDGSGNPATTTAADLDSKTLIFNYWDNGRGIGTFAFDTLGQFNIYQITAETGAVSATFTGGSWGTAQVNSFTWDNNEKVVWSGESETASIYNNTSHPTSEDPKDNLMWNENKEAILIRVYVRAVETEDSLKVVYYDEKFGDTLYSYNIQVEKTHNFTDNMIGTPETLANDRIDVTGCGIENSYGQTQNFQTDLTKVPEAVGKYDSELYSYTGSEIKDDGKTLFLYYNINTNVLKPNFVVDFGLPITFPLSDVTNTPALVKSASASARYGTVSYNSSEKTFTYTPTTILQNVDVLSITLTFDGGSSALTNVGVTPATTVHYEESFITWVGDWTGGTTKPTMTQNTAVLGEDTNNFGYDSAYNTVTGASSATTSTIGATGSFTFTGNGIQVFANATESSGYVSVQVKNSSGAIVNMAMVDTIVDEGTTSVTSGQTGNLYGLPIVSLIDLQNMPHGTYTVTITKIMDTEPVYIDGIRVFNTVKDSTIFNNDLEDNPEFYELRDYVLNALSIGTDAKLTADELDAVVNQVYAAISSDTEAPASAVITSGSNSVITDTDDAQDLLDNGPKNELYLYNGQTLTFKVTSSRIMQIGLKAPQGATTASVIINGGTATEQAVKSSVDMFYNLVSAPTENATEYTVSITNNGSTILSVTLLKVCDDPSFAFASLTSEDIENVLTGVYGLADDEETETPNEPSAPEEEIPTEPTKPSKPSKPNKPGNNGNNKPGKPGSSKPGNSNRPGRPAEDTEPAEEEAILNIVFVNLWGRKVGTATLTESGNENDLCVFSASEISAQTPGNYWALWFFPAIISYGDTATITVTVL